LRIERPAIATIMPTTKGTCIILDVGANVTAPNHLLQFAIKGEFTEIPPKNMNPKVGLRFHR
jgi:glycerol-3-phosphate acyltransferase PlsX